MISEAQRQEDDEAILKAARDGQDFMYKWFENQELNAIKKQKKRISREELEYLHSTIGWT